MHTEAMRDELISRGVDSDRLNVLPHGVEIREVPERPRSVVVCYLGHKLNAAKGLSTLLTSLAILKERMGRPSPLLTIHGHYGRTAPVAGLESVRQAGLDADVRWANEIDFDAATELYQRSLLCVLPYTGSFAGYPATLALANGVPVIGTREAGLPEHLGDCGIFVERDDPQGLAAQMERLLGDEAERRSIALRGRSRAEGELSWPAVAEKTLAVYEKALHDRRRTSSRGRGPAKDPERASPSSGLR